MIPRRNFIAAVGGSSLLLTGTASAEEKSTSPSPTMPARITPAAEAKMVWAMGVRVTIRADSEMTGGGYSAFEDLVLPGQGPPLHTHTKEDETMYVIEGELEVVLGDKTYTARPGDFAHMARGVPHRFKNVSDKPARMLLTYSPGGFEKWFLEIGTPVNDPNGKPPAVTPEEIAKAVKAAEGYGVVFAKKK